MAGASWDAARCVGKAMLWDEATATATVDPVIARQLAHCVITGVAVDIGVWRAEKF